MEKAIKQHMTICADYFACDVPTNDELEEWYEENGTPYDNNSEAELAARTYNLLRRILNEGKIQW